MNGYKGREVIGDTKYTDAEVLAIAIAKALLTTQDDIIVRGASAAERLAVAASRIIGKKASGNIGALTAAEILTIIGVEAGATPDQTGSEIATLVEAAGLTFDENKGITLDAALSADGKWSGIVEAGTAGTTLAFGDLVYLAVADSKWELTDADAEATAFGKIGICVLAASEDAATLILLWGKVRADSAFPALTIGAPVHIGTTPGDIQVAAPNQTADIVRIIGYGNTADELFFCPDNTYVEIA